MGGVVAPTGTVLRLRLEEGLYAEKYFGDLPPLGSTGAEYFIAAWIYPLLSRDNRDREEAAWIEYGYSGDGDPEITMALETTVGDLLDSVRDTAVAPVDGSRTTRGGPYKGWLRASDGWLLDPEGDNG